MSSYFITANDEDETVDDGAEPEAATMTVSTVSQTQTEAHAALAVFWPKVNEEINKIRTMDLKVQALPLARIKKIMKLDEDVKMISAEAPVLFAKAVEIFIHELTLRAWVHTEDNKRRTLQRNDIAMAVAKYDQFDFLIDIVPRDEVKVPTSVGSVTTVKQENTPAKTPEQVQYYLQIAQQHNQILQGNASDAANNQTVTATAGGQLLQIPAGSAAAQGGNIQIVHQLVTPSGEVQNIPLQLNQSQLQVIRMQMQNGTNQPVIVQSVTGQQHNANPIIPTILQ